MKGTVSLTIPPWGLVVEFHSSASSFLPFPPRYAVPNTSGKQQVVSSPCFSWRRGAGAIRSPVAFVGQSVLRDDLHPSADTQYLGSCAMDSEGGASLAARRIAIASVQKKVRPDPSYSCWIRILLVVLSLDI